MNVLAENRLPADERLLFFHVHSPIARADAVLLGGRWKFTISHDCPQGTLYDVHNDPSESHDLSDSEPLMVQRLRAAVDLWRKQQLAYYHFPMYYLHFYPPLPPKWSEVARSQVQ